MKPVNLFLENVDRNKSRNVASTKDVDVAVYVEKTRVMFMPGRQNAGNDHNKIANKYFENQTNLKFCFSIHDPFCSILKT
jgi:hypothetical protein